MWQTNLTDWLIDKGVEKQKWKDVLSNVGEEQRTKNKTWMWNTLWLAAEVFWENQLWERTPDSTPPVSKKKQNVKHRPLRPKNHSSQ